MTARQRALLRFKKKLLTALRKEGADFALHLLSNTGMERVRRSLMARRDFKGAEARKIAREAMVNVLSFPEPEGFPHPETGKLFLGEVFLNLACDAGAPGALEFLMTHGVLHLLGYRHDGLRDTIKMEALEKKLCKRLKIQPPHSS